MNRRAFLLGPIIAAIGGALGAAVLRRRPKAPPVNEFEVKDLQMILVGETSITELYHKNGALIGITRPKKTGVQAHIYASRVGDPLDWDFSPPIIEPR